MSEVPTAIWTGTFNIFGVDITCHTLDNGMRIIEEDSMVRLLDAMCGPVPEDSANDVRAFQAWRLGAKGGPQ